MGRRSIGWARVSDQVRQLGQGLLDQVALPPEARPFEVRYRRAAHQAAVAWFSAHVPALTVLAALGGRSIALALVGSAAVALSASLATVYARDARHAGWLIGALAMAEAALVVTVLQGPWAAEVPGYLFATLVGLALLADPVAVLVALATAALGHAAALAWAPALVPASSAELLARMVALVVAATVSTALARILFDAGAAVSDLLEARTATAAERNREVQAVLDQSIQGILTVSTDGTLVPRWSRLAGEWLGEPRVGATVWEFFATHDETFAQWLALGWQAIDEDVLPHELSLDQLPKRLIADGRHLDVQYRPAGDVYLMILTDRSERAARDRAEAIQAETVRAFEHVLRDRNGFFESWSALEHQVNELCADPPVLTPISVERAIGGLRERASLVGLKSVAEACARVERDLRDSGEPPTLQALREVGQAWHRLAERLAPMLSVGPTDLDVDEADLERLLGVVRARLPHREIEDAVVALRLEPVRRRFERLEAHARHTAARLGIDELHVITDDGGVRVDREATAPFWASLIHVVENAIDHGLRDAHGVRQLTMTARYVEAGQVEVTIADSGAGVRWERVAAAAAMRGLPISTRRALIEAMFSDRLSTRDEASDVSGHGRGLAEVRAACDARGIERRVASETALGTTFTFVLPPELTGATVEVDELRARAG